ncbi:hypothetical protein A0H81_06841 [Grifola frondosa]|uniref:Uncharacterized protein n=1 Tax=Grifola frondosa TaxID=5627 RepID=A0A1C7M8F6_GRIFR|nr:hypothetical protein A0H81_06841 [Grifola frondosa]
MAGAVGRNLVDGRWDFVGAILTFDACLRNVARIHIAISIPSLHATRVPNCLWEGHELRESLLEYSMRSGNSSDLVKVTR